MADLDDLDLNNDPIEFPHDFEVDVNKVVIANHKLTLDGIARSEDEEIAKFEDSFGPEDYESMLSITADVRTFYEDLRRAATNLAVVGIVTRLQHWVGDFDQQIRENRKNGKSAKDSGHSKLVGNLKRLNEELGEGPVPTTYFSELEAVRDSVIHGDSNAEWKFQDKLRRVPKAYVNAYGEVELSEEQFKEAVSKALQQIKWYDDRLQEKGKNQGRKSE